MLKILLVDDEVAILNGMKKLISKVAGNSAVIREAYDGVEALELMEEYEPDVLLTDMKMPGMDGLQLLREAKKRKPDLLTAAISAYSDYDYIREAMLLQTTDYLLKPVTAEDLQALLDNLRRKHAELKLGREQETMEMLLSGTFPGGKLPALPYAYYALLLVCAGPYYNGVVEVCPGDAFWQSPLFKESWAAGIVPGMRQWLIGGERSNERFVLLAADCGVADERVRNGLERWRRQVSNQPIPVTVICALGLTLDQLAAARVQLRKELLHSLVFAKTSVLYLEDPVRRQTRGGAAYSEETAKVLEAARLRRYERFAEQLNTLLDRWEASSATQMVIHQTLIRILADFGQQKMDKHIDLEMLVSHSLSYRELREKLTGFFRPLFETNEIAARPADSIAEQVEQYLRQNFRESITLQSLSQEFGLVPNYLSVIFKRKYGVTPGEYLMEFRIKEAMRLMDEQPHLLLKQVAGQVGYADPLYFSRVFKKLTGQSPTEYAQTRQR
jgi:YesN/AraC family two-component response regulator